MLEILKKIIKPIGLGIGTAILIGAAVCLDPNLWKNTNYNWVDNRKDAPPFDFVQKMKDKPKAILTAKDLRQLRWMNVSQLKAIFDGRRQYYQLDNSPEVYEQLRWMSKEQIEAIFGTGATSS